MREQAQRVTVQGATAEARPLARRRCSCALAALHLQLYVNASPAFAPPSPRFPSLPYQSLPTDSSYFLKSVIASL